MKKGINKVTKGKEIFYKINSLPVNLYFDKQHNLELEKLPSNIVSSLRITNTYQYSGVVVLVYHDNKNKIALPVPCEIYDDISLRKKYFQWANTTCKLKTIDESRFNHCFLASTCGTQLKERDSMINIIRKIYKECPWFSNYVYSTKTTNDEFMQYMNETTLLLKQRFQMNKSFDHFNIANPSLNNENKIDSQKINNIKINESELKKIIEALKQYWSIKKINKEDKELEKEIQSNNYNFKLLALCEKKDEDIDSKEDEFFIAYDIDNKK